MFLGLKIFFLFLVADLFNTEAKTFPTLLKLENLNKCSWDQNFAERWKNIFAKNFDSEFIEILKF